MARPLSPVAAATRRVACSWCCVGPGERCAVTGGPRDGLPASAEHPARFSGAVAAGYLPLQTSCSRIAVLGRDRFPCTGDHSDGLHHFAADRPDPCPAPFCKLPNGHRSLHDIPSGRPTYEDGSDG